LDRLLILLSILALLITGSIKLAHYAYSMILAPLYDHYFSPAEPVAAEPDIYYFSTVDPAILLSKNVLLMEAGTQKILLDKQGQERIYPASMSKIMTVLAALEVIDDLNQTVCVGKDIFPALYAADATTVGFLPDEEVKVLDLLYGAMLPSGADASMMLALHAGGSEREFISLMNWIAKDIGMNDTLFANTTGLHNDSHYTTAKDLALLLDYALKNPVFRTVFTASEYEVAGTNKHPEGLTMSSSLFKRLHDPQIDGGTILGGKTGYTREAGLCMASLAEKAGAEFILITAGAAGNYQSEPAYIYDALTVYEGLGYAKNDE